jgi:peptidoglycan/LPS O-acetylase OafA/YrhL
LLAAFGDWRMIRSGGVNGPRRLARHLWRMCVALFIASGSFFLGQMKFVPEPLRIVPLLAALGVAPLVVLLYWMWRVRVRRTLVWLHGRGGRTVRAGYDALDAAGSSR